VFLCGFKGRKDFLGHLTRVHALQGRALAERAAQELRKSRLAAQSGGGSRVTLSTLASMDEFGDDTEILQRFNVILKVGRPFSYAFWGNDMRFN
jgi:hypothetical protein